MARPCLDRNPKFKLLIRNLGLPKPYVRGLLETLWDAANESGDPVIEAVHLADDVYSDGARGHAPDAVIGYAHGYRCSDDSVLGELSEHLLEDNKDKWSGDHCIDRSLVPGVLFANQPMGAETPSLPDVTVSVLSEFGLAAPREMEGKPVWRG